jgi:hypothetical protein
MTGTTRRETGSDHGVADLNNPPVARQYLDDFDEIWHASAIDENARLASR